MGTKINADDFGISKGVNEAIIKMHKENNLDSASLMVNFNYTQDAIEKAHNNKNLEIGLHFNLTTGKSTLHPISIPLLVDKEGVFKNGFIKLLALSIFKRKAFLSQVEAELKAQMELLKLSNLKILHINGHRHVHYIFGIFNLVHKLAIKEQINHIRIINESLFKTLKLGFIPPISGIIKWFILRFLGAFNSSNKVKNSPYFFSIIHSCNLNNKIYQKFKKNLKGTSAEVMIHPSITSYDSKSNTKYEISHLNSSNREKELDIIK